MIEWRGLHHRIAHEYLPEEMHTPMKSLNGADLKSITRFLHTLPIFSVFGFKILGAAFAFALTVVIGRYLGAEDAGIYYTTISATLLLAFLGSFGLPQVVMREVAVGVHKKDPSFRHSIQRVLKIAAVATSFLSVVVLIGGADIAGSLFKQPSLALYLPWTVLALIGTVVFNLAAESLRGFQQIAYYSYLMFAGVNLVSAVILVSAYGGLGESGNFHPLDVSIFAYVVACVVNAGLALVFVRKVITRTDQGSISLGQVSSNAGLSVGQLVRSGSAFLGYGFATQGIQWIAPLVLAYFRTSDEVAIYSSALRISTLVHRKV